MSIDFRERLSIDALRRIDRMCVYNNNNMCTRIEIHRSERIDIHNIIHNIIQKLHYSGAIISKDIKSPLYYDL